MNEGNLKHIVGLQAKKKFLECNTITEWESKRRFVL